jgi:hypothetical protein
MPSKAPCPGEPPDAELGDLRTHVCFGWPIILRAESAFRANSSPAV